VRRTGLIKAAVALVALGVLGVLFVRSARSVRAEPYEVAQDRLARWTLAIEPAPNASGVVLALRPQRELASALFNQVFARTGESLNGPVPAAMPLVLQSEVDSRVPGTLAPEALLAVARAAGLESATLEPRCMAHRRVSQPGMTRQVYFVLFEWPAFDEFRRQLLRRMREAGGSTSAFDPAALSPVLIVAGSDAAFSSWLPLRANADQDCFAPIAVK
jgi:hypothetical protein